MNRMATSEVTLPEVWCTDSGLRVEVTGAGLRLTGTVLGEDSTIGLRFRDLSVELSLRPGMSAPEAARHLLRGLPADVTLELAADADAAELRQPREATGAELAVPEPQRAPLDAGAR